MSMAGMMPRGDQVAACVSFALQQDDARVKTRGRPRSYPTRPSPMSDIERADEMEYRFRKQDGILVLP